MLSILVTTEWRRDPDSYPTPTIAVSGRTVEITFVVCVLGLTA